MSECIHFLWYLDTALPTFGCKSLRFSQSSNAKGSTLTQRLAKKTEASVLEALGRLATPDFQQ